MQIWYNRSHMEHYIDNKVFLQQMEDYKSEIRAAEEANEDLPPIPDEIAESFIKIANGLGNRPNFVNYTYKD